MNIFKQIIAKSLGLSFEYLPNSGGHKYFTNDDNRLNSGFESSEYNGNQQYGRVNFDRLIETGYAQNSDVYAIVNKVIETATDIPLLLYNQTNDGDILIEEGDLYDMLKNPNDTQTEKEFRSEAGGNLLLTGNVFLRGHTIIGFGDAQMQQNVIPSNCVQLRIKNGIVTGYQVNIYGRTYVIDDVDEVFHGRYFDPTKQGINDMLGLSPLQAGFRSLTASNELIQAEASYYKNKGVSGLLSSKTDKAVSSVEAGLIQKIVNYRIGGSSKAGGVAATNAALDFTPIGMSPQDLKMIQSHNIKLRSLCRLYGVDSSLFGDTENKTFSSRSEAEKSLYTNAAIPLNNRYISYQDRFLLPNWNIRDGAKYKLKQDVESIAAMAEDQTAQANRNNIKTTGILQVTNSNLSDEGKVDLLVNVHGISEDGAQLLIQQNETLSNGTTGTADESAADSE